MNRSVVIVGGKRTPIGRLLGTLSGHDATRLGSIAMAGSVKAAGLGLDEVDEVCMGCVLPAGLGQAPARQAALGAGMTTVMPATTVNKMCGSGMKAIMIACDQIMAGSSRTVVAGGMESMSNAPYLLPDARRGSKFGHTAVKDHMLLDGLEDAYEPGRLMGEFAEECAKRYRLSREIQNSFAVESYHRARKSQQGGIFSREIVPVCSRDKQDWAERAVALDEEPTFPDLARVDQLQPVFSSNGTITAASSSKISDGAAATVVIDAELANRSGIKPTARIVAHASVARKPAEFPVAPVNAARELLDITGWSIDSVDFWEINEAFAVVPMIFMRELGIDHGRINAAGGACALGHPIGASGTRIVVTLLNIMHMNNAQRGIAAICIGGGEATAMALELV